MALAAVHLQINAEVADEYLCLRRQAQLNNPSLQDVKKHPIYEYNIIKDPETQYKLAKANVSCLLSGDLGCVVDETVGRMHTVLTNMKSDLRNLITYQGKPMVSVDIANSQPYLATLLFTKQFYQNSARFLNIHTIDDKIRLSQQQHSLMLAEIAQISANEDFNLYQSLVGRVGEEGMICTLICLRNARNTASLLRIARK
jgi:hypothetical protein